MPKIVHHQRINAPIDLVFDLARNVDVHTQTTSKTKEKAVAGVTRGLLEVGDQVTWEAVHLGVKQRLTAQVTVMERPNIFVDVMVKGAFHSFVHTHHFVEERNGTIMTDTFEYISPLGPLGLLADKLFLERYMINFIRRRSIELKKIAEQLRK